MKHNFSKIYHFIDDFKEKDIEYLSNNIALIYRNYEKKPSKLLIIKIRSYCRKKKIKNNFPNITIGLGSITNVKQFEEVVDYQFDFFVSPGIIEEVINLNTKNYIPGAESISEFNFLLNKKSIEFPDSCIV